MKILDGFDYANPFDCTYIIDCKAGDCRSYFINNLNILDNHYPNSFKYMASPYYPSRYSKFSGSPEAQQKIAPIVRF